MEVKAKSQHLSFLIEFHRHIIGQDGIGVRDICFTAQDANFDVVLISEVHINVDAVRIGLDGKIKKLEVEKEAKTQKSFEVTVEINPKYHPNIIGRGGEVIEKL